MKKLNHQILELLKSDARYPLKDIAKMLGESVDTVEKAVASMESDGTIVKYTIVIDGDKADKETVNALIEVKVSPLKETGFDDIARYIYQFDEVKNVYLMSGAYDLAVFIEGESLKEVARFVSEKLSAIDKVLSTATHFILKKYKVEGIILDKPAGKRLAVQP